MRVEELWLESFRNYSREKVVFSPGINYIVGNNGEGKTNMLESIFVLATTKSHRQASERELVKLGHDHFHIRAQVKTQVVDRKLELGYYTVLRKKIAHVSGIPTSRLQDFVGLLNVVMFSPEDLNLVKGAPGERRRFLDILLCQVDRVYLRLLQHYGQVLRQRNEALKQIAREKLRPADLQPWDQQFAALALRVTARRLQAVEKISHLFATFTGEINQGKEKQSLAYQSSLSVNRIPFDVEALTHELGRRRADEIKKGATGIGPHRDDLCFLINGLPAAAYASQGQQRTAVLGLKLAELVYMQEVSGDYPVLLLDDVLSELDYGRRHMLARVLAKDVQAIITGTDEGALEMQGLRPASIMRIENGRVVGDGLIYLQPNETK